MKILLYNPDNGVTRNFMPHLWMFLLRALTPPGHEVLMIDGNAKPMDEQQLVRFIKEQNGHRRHDQDGGQSLSGRGRNSGGRGAGGNGRSTRNGIA